MKLGFIGLGRMGYNMVEHLLEEGHEVVAFDINKETVAKAVEAGAEGSGSIPELVEKLDGQRFIWIMVQRAVVQTVLDEVMPLVNKGDVIVDGGNTFYKETLERAQVANEQGITYMDVGVSGGMERARTGACLMIGGPRETFEKYEPIFKTLAQPDGYGYMGKTGAGHFVKMVHNGIEYGMMQSIAEGIETIREHRDDFGFDLTTVLRVYNNGSIVESALTKWLARAWEEDNDLESIAGTVPIGDTEAEMNELTGLGHMPSLETAINERARSREEPRFAAKAVAAMRNQFGGHSVKKKED